MLVLLYITRPRGITATIAIVIGLRVVYNVVYKGDKNKSVVREKMILFCFCFKVLSVSYQNCLCKKHALHEQDKVYARTALYYLDSRWFNYDTRSYVDMQILQNGRMC